MSNYSILHKRFNGVETYQVFWKDRPLDYYHPSVMEHDEFRDFYYNIENAKELIRLHKESLKWLEEQRKLNVTEWLNEEGKPLKDFSVKQHDFYVEESPKTININIGWACAAVALVILLMLGAIFTG